MRQAQRAPLLVVALEQALAGPICTSRFVDGGARVIKIERPEGDFARHYDRMVGGDSTYFTWVNRGKESLVADIKNPLDLGLLRRILRRADVFVQNLAPGATSRAGLDSEELRAANKRLVTMDISGYGEDGPKAHFKAYDLLVQAESGLAAVTGPEHAPARIGVSVCDVMCGVNAHGAILQALLDRETTGEGRGLKTSLFAGAAELMTVPFLQQLETGRPPVSIGLAHPAIAPYGAYPTADGHSVLLGIQNEREWRQLCTGLVGQASLADEERFCRPERRVANRAQLDPIIAGHTRRLTRDALIATLVKAGVACAAVNSVADLIQHPQLHTVTGYTSTGYATKLPAPPVSSSTHNHKPHAPEKVPAIGQHSAAIRAEFAA